MDKNSDTELGAKLYSLRSSEKLYNAIGSEYVLFSSVRVIFFICISRKEKKSFHLYSLSSSNLNFLLGNELAIIEYDFLYHGAHLMGLFVLLLMADIY